MISKYWRILYQRHVCIIGVPPFFRWKKVRKIPPQKRCCCLLDPLPLRFFFQATAAAAAAAAAAGTSSSSFLFSPPPQIINLIDPSVRGYTYTIRTRCYTGGRCLIPEYKRRSRLIERAEPTLALADLIAEDGRGKEYLGLKGMQLLLNRVVFSALLYNANYESTYFIFAEII